AGRAANLNPASKAQVKTILVLVDVQVDFVHETGALVVPGAVEDTRRTIEWIFNNVNRITTIAASLDSHVPIQIFFPTWWADENNEHPAPYTVIRSEEVQAGKWRPLYDEDWSMEYVELLEKGSRKELMIWPYHCLEGTPGHSLMPALYEAIAYHSAARRTQPIFLSKGSIPQTEYYSMLEPEVKVPEHPLGTLNTDFLNTVASYDKIYVAGQAKSHCVLETVSSMMRYFDDQPKVINKMRVLKDCMSSVRHPTIDFDTMANKALKAFEQRGLQIADSSMPLR
ncbi:MAG: cysteine hydrolase family protein, partial [Anaerolinea sp.]|nr:cysteine hydrolase family protein [Anaerolinea sp.]